MTQERKEQLLDELFNWAVENYELYPLYEWARNVGMSDVEIKEMLYSFDDETLKEYHNQYEEDYNWVGGKIWNYIYYNAKTKTVSKKLYGPGSVAKVGEPSKLENIECIDGHCY